MQKKLLREAENYVQINSRRRIWKKFVQAMACIVVFCTTYLLILPALTMERISCGMEEHTHTDACYQTVVNETSALICTKESVCPHVHTDQCLDDEGILCCGYSDFVVHSHNETCFGAEGVLYCSLPVVEAHTHCESCYDTADSSVLLCGREEIILHTHTGDCFDESGALLCPLTEIRCHEHTDGCQQITLGEPQLVLTCGTEAHVHGAECEGKKPDPTGHPSETEGAEMTTAPAEPEETTAPAEPEESTAPAKPEETTAPLEPEGIEGSDTEEITEVSDVKIPELQSDNYAISSVSDAVVDADYVINDIVASGSNWQLGEGVLKITGTGNLSNFNPQDMNYPWWDYVDAIEVIIIGEGITSVPAYLDYGCVNLKRFIVDEDNATYASQNGLLLKGTSLLRCPFGWEGTCEIPEGITAITETAFCDCAGVTEVVIPTTVTSVKSNAFNGCKSLTAFEVSSDNATCSTIDGVLFNKAQNELWRYPTGRQGAYDFPNSIRSVSSLAFSDCAGLTAVNLHQTQNPTYIKQGAFSGCTSLVEFTVTQGSTNASAVDGVLFSADQKTLYLYPTGKTGQYTVPDSVTTIYGNAFYSCKSLTEVSLQENLKTIEAYAFQYCTSLEKINLPNSLTKISGYAFYSCTALKSISIPAGVPALNGYTFSGCSSLETVELKENLVTLGNGEFYGCSSLKNITLPSTVRNLGTNVFSQCTSLKHMEIPEGVTTIPVGMFNKCTGLETVVLPSTVTAIGGSAFEGCRSLSSINIPVGVTRIEPGTFWSCGLNYLELPEGVTYIGTRAFMGTDLREVILPSTVEYFGYQAFCYSTELKSIRIPENTTHLESSVLWHTNRMEVITLAAKNLKDVPTDTGGWSGAKTLVIADTVEVLDSSFLTSLGYQYKRLIFEGPNTFTYSGEPLYVFAGKDYIYLTDGVTYSVSEAGIVTIGVSGTEDEQWTVQDGTLIVEGEGAMENYPEGEAPWSGMASQITKVVIAEGVTSIGDFAFEGMTDLVSIDIPSTVTSVGKYAFHDCFNLTEVLIPDGIAIGEGAFVGCSKLAEIDAYTVGDDGTRIYTFYDTLEEVTAGFPGTVDNDYMGTIFWTAAMQNMVSDDALILTDSAGRIVRLTTPENGQILLTGQSSGSALTIDKGNDTLGDYIRVYFRFSNAGGNIGYDVGEYTFDGHAVRVVAADTPNTWYMEVEPLAAGETLSLNLPAAYQNFTSGGGTVSIWLEKLTDAERTDLNNKATQPDEIHMVTWVTEADVFPVEKTNRYSPVVCGDGTEDGLITLRNLSYYIKMTSMQTTGDYGQDIMIRAEFQDTLTLPDVFYWHEDLLEAVRNQQMRLSYGTLYAIIDGEERILCTLNTRPSMARARIIKGEDGRENIQIYWTVDNPDRAAEMPNYSDVLSFSNEFIVADMDAIVEDIEANGGVPPKYTILNTVTCDQNFLYSQPQHQTAAFSQEVSAGLASFDIGKKVSSRTIYMGDGTTFTITLNNPKTLPYTIMKRVEDVLPEYFYIAGSDMETMLRAEPWGKDLTIRISDAVLYGASYKFNVVGSRGESFVITQQQLGTNTPHDGMVEDTSGDDANIRCKNGQIIIQWSEDGQTLILKTIEDGTETSHTIGSGCDYATVQDALDGIGYLVTRSAVYTCTWNRTGKALYSGQTVNLIIPAHAKDTMMMLKGDQYHFITEEPIFVSGFTNFAKAYSQIGDSPETVRSANCGNIQINRDYTLSKTALVNNTAAQLIKEGSVVHYRIDLANMANTAVSNCAPLVDKMSGAQCLLAPASENTVLAEKGLKRYVWNEETYYLLNQPGTYDQVMIDGYLADRVVVTRTEEGLDTMIYWYFDQSFRDTIQILYPALADMEEAGLSEDTFAFTLSNEVWLNDHQTHRLYDSVLYGGSRLHIHKEIATNYPVVTQGEDGIYVAEHPDADNVVHDSIVAEGQQVIYRLHLDGKGSVNSITIEGSEMMDALPKSLNNYWSKENVKLFYAKTTGTTAEISQIDGSEWDITTDSEDSNQQYIRWNDDFTIRMNGDLYIYVFLTFPANTSDGANWTDYCYHYGSENLVNSFFVNQLQSDAFHLLKEEGSVYLQKGILHTGSALGTKYTNFAGEDDLNHYANDGTETGIVTYYISLVNDGLTRMYLSDIQDTLPKGFTFHSFYIDSETVGTEEDGRISDNSGYAADLAVVSSAHHKNVVYKTAQIQYTQYVQPGQTRLTFSLYNSPLVGDLAYDDYRDMYYLNPGEAVVFAYNCQTNNFSATEDYANNVAAMPFYDYNGTGLNIAEITVDRAVSNGQYSKNGECNSLENVQMELMGFNTEKTDHSTVWMISEVAVQRGVIVPGIIKRTPSPFALTTSPITWTIEATNSGTDTIRSYTLTDVMDAPYQICGDVLFSIRQRGTTATDTILFTFDSRTSLDTTVFITANDGEKDVTYALYVNGAAVEVASVWNNRPITPRVSLKRAEDGTETLNIEFTEKDVAVTGLSPGSVARLVLTTYNGSNNYSNTAYINTAYLTPCEEQYYDIASVTQGTNTLLDNKAAVMSEANVTVSYGYATASEKIVTELDTSQSVNSATSNSATNYIILTDVDSVFRYTLKVTNTGGESVGTQSSSAMGQLVLIDNLPQIGDSITLYSDRARFSDFTVNFAHDPNVTVMVNGQVLDPQYYTVSYSTKTQDFTDHDWDGSSVWNSTSDEMRAIRIVITDPSDTVDSTDIIPPGAEVTVSFNAVIDTSGQTGESIDPSDMAWNTFGYQFRLKGDTLMLKASPMKVGIKIACVPTLTKLLMDPGNNAVTARTDTTFRFLIYKGASRSLSSFSGVVAAQELSEAGIPFTVVDLKVKAGESSATLLMENLTCWTLENGVLTATAIPWRWENLGQYTLVELESDANSTWNFGGINGIRPNNSSFTNSAVSTISLNCHNIRNLWTMQLFKQSNPGCKALGGAVFGLYSPNSEDQMTNAEHEALLARYEIMADITATFDGRTWYLMDIQVTENNLGMIQWDGLAEAGYYLLELRPPAGYRMNEQPGEIVTAPGGLTGSKTVHISNVSSYELPDTGGQVVLLYTMGILLMIASAFLLSICKKRCRGYTCSF